VYINNYIILITQFALLIKILTDNCHCTYGVRPQCHWSYIG